MKFLYSLDHTNCANLDTKHIGYFQTYEAALSAIDVLNNELGFSDHPNDFEITIVQFFWEKASSKAYELVKEVSLDDFEKAYCIGVFGKRKDAEAFRLTLKKDGKSKVGIYKCLIGNIGWGEGFISWGEAMQEFQSEKESSAWAV